DGGGEEDQIAANDDTAAVGTAEAKGDKDDDKDDDDKDSDKAASKAKGDKDDDKDDMVLVDALPAATWGTDETILAAGFTAKVDKLEEGTEEPDPGTEEPDPGTEEPEDEVVEKKVEKKVAARTPTAAERRRAAAERKRAAAERRRATAERKRQARIRRDKARKAAEARKAKSSGSGSKDLARASALYKQKKFSAAASLLRSSAKRNKGDASKMKKLASAYASVGSNLAKGDKSRSNAPVAVTAYNKALRADRKAGGAFQSLLRVKLKILAPKAAKTAMARKDLTGAKRMADIAASVGAGAKVSSVRSSLERQAGKLVSAARRDARSGRKSSAKKKYATAKKIVPRSSKNYRAAVAGLRAL
ncbi:MAG: hypothetical protein KJO07_10760, partial [Deltaproteobacteria bacterium]|nr:hypothetical protein [Deltaproteobacteria bacterium]